MRICWFVMTLAATLPAHADPLVLRRVMLSTGGVGYFEYQARLDGPAALSLDVPLDRVDDVLASLVVFDDAGSVGGVELPGQDDRRAAFAALPIPANALSSPLAYLNSLQGVALSVSGPRPMRGRLLRAEEVVQPATQPSVPPVRRTRVSLLTDQGLQQFVLEDADSVQVDDPALREAIGRALDALRGQASQQSRTLTLRAGGGGARDVPRDVHVGYVAAAPLWKTSYRLILPAAPGMPARLQGWAVLENDSVSDWTAVDLTLQYGNPVTFRQALYDSYYVERPTVPVEVLGRLLPGVDTGEAPAMAQMSMAPSAPAPADDRARGRLAARASRTPRLAAPEAETPASEGAEATLFNLPHPVSLAAGHSLTVPILDHAVPAERIGVVTPDRAHPVQALQIRNDTGASLPAGMLTLYDSVAGTSFAGNARLGGLPVGETRLLQFAEDLRTKVIWLTTWGTTFAGITAAQGVVRVRQRTRATHRITLTAPPSEPRRLVLEIARTADAELSLEGGLAPSGQTAQAWRVPVSLAPGETRVVSAFVDRMSEDRIALLDKPDAVVAVLNEQALPEAARAALRHVADLRAEQAARQADLDRLEADRTAIDADEERLRKNLAVAAAGSALQAQLTRALAADEDRLTELAGRIGAAQEAVAKAKETLAQAIRALRI